MLLSTCDCARELDVPRDIDYCARNKDDVLVKTPLYIRLFRKKNYNVIGKEKKSYRHKKKNVKQR